MEDQTITKCRTCHKNLTWNPSSKSFVPCMYQNTDRSKHLKCYEKCHCNIKFQEVVNPFANPVLNEPNINLRFSYLQESAHCSQQYPIQYPIQAPKAIYPLVEEHKDKYIINALVNQLSISINRITALEEKVSYLMGLISHKNENSNHPEYDYEDFKNMEELEKEFANSDFF